MSQDQTQPTDLDESQSQNFRVPSLEIGEEIAVVIQDVLSQIIEEYSHANNLVVLELKFDCSSMVSNLKQYSETLKQKKEEPILPVEDLNIILGQYKSIFEGLVDLHRRVQTALDNEDEDGLNAMKPEINIYYGHHRESSAKTILQLLKELRNPVAQDNEADWFDSDDARVPLSPDSEDSASIFEIADHQQSQ